MRVYRKNECVVFKKTKELYGGLSNMAAGYTIKVGSFSVRSSEALYQACRYPDYADIQEKIIRQASPMTAKMISHKFLKYTREDWLDVRITIMQWCIRAKLISNYESFSCLLLSTGDKDIVEESHKDDFWAAKNDGNGNLIGCNILGRLLMELRGQLVSFNKQAPKRLPPPHIPNFKLFGVDVCDIEFNRGEVVQNLLL